MRNKITNFLFAKKCTFTVEMIPFNSASGDALYN